MQSDAILRDGVAASGQIANFQTQFPGAHFRSNELFEQNSQLLSAWTMFNRNGSEFLTGHSYAKLNDEGRLLHLAGFWKQ